MKRAKQKEKGRNDHQKRKKQIISDSDENKQEPKDEKTTKKLFY
jgi:hypothetical protein